ncbi:MAG: hypothetical protein WC966_10525 [Bradymonadales bacterium]
MRRKWRVSALWSALMAIALLWGCAQDVGDIDRTQPNRLRKSDLEGTWWIGQKITDVPSTSSGYGGFEGLQMDLDKVILVAEEKYLVAYRSYPHLPGSDNTGLELQGPNSYETLYGDNYRGSILAMFPIESHFDVQRSYDAQTGEQSNVIEENSSDRPWHEREYVRVDWSGNPLINFEMLIYGISLRLGTHQTPEVDATTSPYFEYNSEGELQYFDAPGLYVAEPSIWSCIGGQMMQLWYGECGATQVRVVTSFMKDDGNRNYEPLQYSDQMMNRFGYFRSEHYTYDARGGIYNSGRILLANRHNIWKSAYKTNDETGKKELIPIENREVRTAPYYIRNMPSDPLIQAAAIKSVNEWNRAFKLAYKNTIASISNVAENANADFFVPCHIPVKEGDHEVCGPVGYSPREGDLRKNVLWIVDQRMDAGLLGYGPPANDPLTGETLSANAHVYLSAMGEVAGSLLEQIKFYNNDLDITGVQNNEYLIRRAERAKESLIDARKIADAAHRTKLGERSDTQRRQMEKREQKLTQLTKFDASAFDTRLAKISKAGLLDNSDNNVIYKHVAKLAGMSVDALPVDIIDEYSPAKNFSYKKRQYERAIKQKLTAERVMCFKEMMDDVRLAGYAQKYKGRVDYDTMWREMRADVFYSTSIHEMGHSFGLRHNFSGSYDSLNYFDKFWELRKDPTFTKKEKTLGDLYEFYAFTDKQLEENMLGNMYSSIMDYQGYTVENQGLGKYDEAAIAFAYSAGSSVVKLSATDCQKQGGKVNSAGQCLMHRDGFVQVFDKTLDQLGKAGQILNSPDTTQSSTHDDPISAGQPYLELIHYSTFMNSFPAFEDAFNRHWMRLDDYLAEKNGPNKAQRHVRVPYLFGTDDIAEKLASCKRFDHGADLFQQVKNTITNYREYYPFTEFARGRAYWSGYYDSVGRHARNFFTLSDLFQNWYIGDHRFAEKFEDEFIGDLQYASVYTIFNFFAEVLATPEYGLYCKKTRSGTISGQPLSIDSAKTPNETSEFYRDAYCDGADVEDGIDYFYVRQGEGRSRYVHYDRAGGYAYEMFEQENGHVYTTWYAILALFDNEADVIAPGGDIGTYTFGLYDFFDEQIAQLSNAVLAENYNYHSPVLVTKDKAGNDITEAWGGSVYSSGYLAYPKALTLGAGNFTIDPETGDYANASFSTIGKVPGEPCVNDFECVQGIPGKTRGLCASLYEDMKVDRCFLLVDKNSGVPCPESTASVSVSANVCVPSLYVGDDMEAKFDEYAQLECSATNIVGKCSEVGQACVNGTCVDTTIPRIETSTSISQMQYLTLFGILLTNTSMESSFFDQLRVYKVGSGEGTAPGPGYKMITAANPFTGEVYAANVIDQEFCANKENAHVVNCREEGRFLHTNGGGLLIQRLQNEVEAYRAAMLVFDATEDAYYEKTASYDDLIRDYRKMAMAKYNVLDVIRTINWLRGVNNVFGTLF